MCDELRAELKVFEERFRECLRDMETHLLQAFYAFAESNQMQSANLERSHLGLRARLTAIETRMTEVEKRLNMPLPKIRSLGAVAWPKSPLSQFPPKPSMGHIWPESF